jgi:O-antigen/teichoic acid export membrane protein/ADP-heptose:LPS heptosyltransferase
VLQRIRGVIERDPRLSRVLHGGASALLGSVVALGVSAISLPLTVRYLGAEQYGIWVTVSTTVVLMSVLDLGIANSLTNMIARAFAAGDRTAAQRAYATALWTCTAVSAAGGVAAWALWSYVPWASLFRVHEVRLAHEAEICAAIAVAFFLASLPLKLINRVLGGYQETQIANYASLLNSVLGLVAILGVMAWGGSLVQLMLFYSVMMLAGTLALNVWVVLWRKRWMKPWPSMVSPGSVRELLGTGSGFLLLQISALVVFNCDNIIIAHYLGAADVTPYSVTMRLATYASALQIALFPSLWPAYAEAYARGDYEWVRTVFWKAVRYAMGAAGIAVVVLALSGRPLIRWYVGAAAVPSEWLIVAICLWTLIATGMELESCLLLALDRVKFLAVLSLVAAVVNVGLSIYWVRRIGSVGVVLGTIASYLLVLVGAQSVLVWKALYRPAAESRELSPALRALVLPVLWMVVMLRAGWGLRMLERLGILRVKDAKNGESQKILVVYLTKHLGDLVLMLPMIEKLRENYPLARLEVAVEKSAISLFDALRSVDSVWAFDVRGDSAQTWGEAILLSRKITKEYLRLMAGEPPPDVCIVPRWLDDGLRSRELAYLTRASRRIGFEWLMFSDRLPFADQALTDTVTGGNRMHEAAKPLYLLQTAGMLPESDLAEVSVRCIRSLEEIAKGVNWISLARRIGVDPERRLAVIAPGAADARRTWPLERWADVGRMLKRMGFLVVVLSGPSDSQLAVELNDLLEQQGEGSSAAVAGVTSIAETVALLSHCSVYLGADSGPGHIAGGLGVPTIEQFISVAGSDPDGRHAPERFRPVGPHVTCVRIARTVEPCAGACFSDRQHCILTIETEEMLKVVREALAGVEMKASSAPV